ncbi:hypothetical protein TTHERM_00569380 (macronuclear) [Tetrahymena thermophila SB210]|uniref:Kinase domain protein n=1 Tax=Tetrahymena thermophila (strain SB210) TaxID=312017 RepID=Q24I38_TETTS|nr:hypothetical protein TTHERM_00569380 [Tetrahymena thermophila SB210]EAS07400.2 hypothetical protein TTHERM_00569380 [Tetrahymena thermophila SB210]|eukprot:XP_001027642.2 hypothetical protein TTHERM_00569380 [Tetrahymena thermophila SB210]
MFQIYDSNYGFRKINSDQNNSVLKNVKKQADFLQQNALYIDLSSHHQQNVEIINRMFQEISYQSFYLIRLQLILNKVAYELRLFKLMSQLRCIEQVDIICIDENSLDLAFLILEAISHRNIRELAFNIESIYTDQPAYHIKILRALQNMEQLEYLMLSFNENEQVPQLKPLKLINSVKNFKLKGGRKIYDYYLTLFPKLETIQLKPDKIQFKFSNNLVNQLENLQELTIQSINFVRLNNLINLQKLTITEKFTGFTYFDDFKYLQNLKKLIILPQLSQIDVKWLNLIPFFPKGCLVEIKTLYYSELLPLGQNTNILLKISQLHICANDSPQIVQSYKNWGGIRYLQNLISLEQDICHGEKFSDHEITKFVENLTQCEQLTFLRIKFFSQNLRNSCLIPSQIQKELALKTDIIFLETDLKFNKQFHQLLYQKQAAFLIIIIYKKLIQKYYSIPFQHEL